MPYVHWYSPCVRGRSSYFKGPISTTTMTTTTTITIRHKCWTQVLLPCCTQESNAQEKNRAIAAICCSITQSVHSKCILLTHFLSIHPAERFSLLIQIHKQKPRTCTYTTDPPAQQYTHCSVNEWTNRHRQGDIWQEWWWKMILLDVWWLNK